MKTAMNKGNQCDYATDKFKKLNHKKTEVD